MKHFLSIVLLASLLLAWTAGCAPAAKPEPAIATATRAPTTTPVPTTTPLPTPMNLTTQQAVDLLHWLGNAVFLYHGSQNIYFDPVGLIGSDLPKADIILITHNHSDHWSVDDLKKVIEPKTTLVIAPNIADLYAAAKDQLGIPATLLEEGKSIEVNGVKIEAVPAYDIQFHSKGGGGVGYIVTVDGQRLYITGGTSAYPEMAQHACDIVMLPGYRSDWLNEMIEVIPAKAFIIDHVSDTVAKSLAAKLNNTIGGKTVLALKVTLHP